MIYNMNSSGITSNTLYNQTKIVISQSVTSSNNEPKQKIFITKNKPTFSTSSSNKNINYSRNKITKNAK